MRAAIPVVFMAFQAVMALVTRDHNSTTNSSKTACLALSLEFGSALHLYPSDDPNFSLWDEKALEILVDNNCQFAIKSGGHSPVTGASNSDGGVTTDMSRLDKVQVNEDHTRADVGLGAVLGPVYSTLESYNLTFVGGRVADVGVGGFTLGGGVSNLTPQYGLAVDNVFEYEVVLPNSTIVKANEHEHPDLYFGLRGGGNNFGIVTNFHVRLVPQGALLSGAKTYHAKYSDQVLDQIYQLTTTLSNDTYMSFSSRYAWNQTTGKYSSVITQAYYEPVLKPRVFDGLNRIPYESSTVRVDRMSSFAYEGAGVHGARHLFASLSFKPSATLNRRIWDIFEEEVERVGDTEGFSSSVVVSALHINGIKNMKVRGGNAIGVESDGPLNVVLLTYGWSWAKDDEVMYESADRFISRSEAAASDMNLLHPWKHLNYASSNQEPFAGYGGDNAQRLRNIQKRYDPQGIFTSQGLCRGYFKLL